MLQELKYLGAKTITSFAITSSFFISGVTYGNIFSLVGTTIGGTLGAVIGGLVSQQVDKKVIEPYLLKSDDIIFESERDIGLESFKELNGRDYTKKEFDQKVKKCLQNEHSDNYEEEALKKNALEKIFKIQKSKELIYKHRNWN
ncbi:hypothetical protein ABPG74_005050 [Tetrahymena malaccensis]